MHWNVRRLKFWRTKSFAAVEVSAVAFLRFVDVVEIRLSLVAIVVSFAGSRMTVRLATCPVAGSPRSDALSPSCASGSAVRRCGRRLSLQPRYRVASGREFFGVDFIVTVAKRIFAFAFRFAGSILLTLLA